MQVIRCESIYDPMQGACAYVSGEHWLHLPPPWRDYGIEREIMRHEVCAAPPHRLDEWFPQELRAALRLQGLRFVILDVADAKPAVGRYQVIFDRDLAVEVGEYLQ